MLAEVFMLQLETEMRAAEDQARAETLRLGAMPAGAPTPEGSSAKLRGGSFLPDSLSLSIEPEKL